MGLLHWLLGRDEDEAEDKEPPAHAPPAPEDPRDAPAAPMVGLPFGLG